MGTRRLGKSIWVTATLLAWLLFVATLGTVVGQEAFSTEAPSVEDSTEPLNSTGIDYETENMLALRWKIVQDGVSYEGLQFNMHFTVSDYIQKSLVRYSIYDGPGCSASANFITHLNYFTVVVTEDDTKPGIGLGTRDLTLSTIINPQNITTSTVYREKNGETEIRFCMRLSLYDQPDSDPTAMEINHVETSISLIVDLKDEFKIQSQVVQAQDRGKETSEDAFFVEAFLCTEVGTRIVDTGVLLQGQMLRVCVQPTAQAVEVGFRMRSIDRFTFWQGYVSQEAIINSQASINGLTDLSCDVDAEQCVFETLLVAPFFKGPNTVDGEGFATLQFGSVSERRRLRTGFQPPNPRQLAGGQKALQLDRFQIQRRDRPTSDARSSSLTLWFMVTGSLLINQIIQLL